MNKVKEVIVEFGDVGSTYASVITDSSGDHFRVKNSTNADVVMRFSTPVRFNGTTYTNEITLPANDIMEKPIVIRHSGDVEIKYKTSAPTSGNVLIQSIESE